MQLCGPDASTAAGMAAQRADGSAACGTALAVGFTAGGPAPGPTGRPSGGVGCVAAPRRARRRRGGSEQWLPPHGAVPPSAASAAAAPLPSATAAAAAPLCCSGDSLKPAPEANCSRLSITVLLGLDRPAWRRQGARVRAGLWQNPGLCGGGRAGLTLLA